MEENIDPPTDVYVRNEGSIWLFCPESKAGADWILENVDDDSQFLGSNLAVEARYAPDIVLGMRDDGLIVNAW